MNFFNGFNIFNLDMLNFEPLKTKYIAARKNLDHVIKEHPVPYLENPPLPRSLSSSPYSSGLHVYRIDDFIGDPRYEYVCAYMRLADAHEEVNKYFFWINFIRTLQIDNTFLPPTDIFELYQILEVVPPPLENIYSNIRHLIRNSPLLM